MTRRYHLIAFLAASLLCACNGTEHAAAIAPDDGTGPPPPPPPVGKTSYHYLGLLWGSWAGPGYLGIDDGTCAGLVYQPNNSPVPTECIDTFKLDGTLTTRENLKTGQIIELYIQPNDEAWIDIRTSVIGPVEVIDSVRGQLTVLGQRVYFTDQTQGTAWSLPDLTVGDLVQVSGHFSADGQIIASLIDHHSLPGNLQLRGILTQAPNGSFRIGDIVVDLSGASLETFPGGTASPGDPVLLLAELEPQGGVLSVQTARYAGGIWDPVADDRQIFEVDGLITEWRGGFDFDISGYRFYYSTWDCVECNRLFEQGRSVSVGTPVTFRSDETSNMYLDLAPPTWSSTSLIGRIDSIDGSAAALSVGGFPVQTLPATHISADAEPWVGSDTFSVADLAIGDIVTVTGGQSMGLLMAGSIGRVGEGFRIHTQNYDRVGPTVVVLGRSILTDAGTVLMACDDYNSACRRADLQWLWDNTDYFQPVLTIDIDPASDPLRATHIMAVRDP